MKIEIHILQSFAPSCLNRDETNTPKGCLFGGVRRARVSSQCLKRSMRTLMDEALKLPTGKRTRRLAGLAEELERRGRDRAEAEARSRKALEAVKLKTEDRDGLLRTMIGLYLAPEEMAALADAVEADWDDLGGDKPKAAAFDRAAKSLSSRTQATDIALFGRMMTDLEHMNVDAACQVAHALSTHEVGVESDFFTAVDDLQPDADPGAGMMGTSEFQSATFYRYAVIDRAQLVANLNGDTALADRAIVGFVQAAVEAVPTGRQNSSAAQNPPDYVEVVLNDRLPRSLANAFEAPVRRNGGGSYLGRSIEALVLYQQHLNDAYGEPGHRRRVSTQRDHSDGNFASLLDWLREALPGEA